MNDRQFPHLDVRTHLRRHLDQFAGPVLIITHDPLEAMIMADRLLVIENGRVVQQGSPAQVASHPATQYVARLVGLNLYTGTLEVATRRVFLDAGGTFTVTLSEDDPTASAPDGQSTRPVLVGLRPSAITVHTALPTHGSPHNVWKGTVTGLDQLTDRVQVDATPPPRQPLSTSPPRPWPNLRRGRGRPRTTTRQRSVALGQSHRDRGVSRPRYPSQAVTLPDAPDPLRTSPSSSPDVR